jgi:hypothetical protein
MSDAKFKPGDFVRWVDRAKHGQWKVKERVLPPVFCIGLAPPHPYYLIARYATFSDVEGDIRFATAQEKEIEPWAPSSLPDDESSIEP